MQLIKHHGSRSAYRWPDIPSADDVRQELQRIFEDGSLYRAMDRLENTQDEYPNTDDCLDNVALTVLARGKRIKDMTDADFVLIGAHMAQWFEKHALLPITQLEQASVAQRLDDEAAERECEISDSAWGVAS